MLADNDVRITVLHRLIGIERRGSRLAVRLQVEGAKMVTERLVETVVIEHGTVPDPELFAALVDRSVNLGEIVVTDLLARRPQSARYHPAGEFELYRVGDAVASRNIHAAILDSYRLCCLI
jgi:hypothetical protein